MPTINQNIEQWDKEYDWKENGDEWSESWGRTDILWWWVIYPRIYKYLQCENILEIAPGRGRFTQYLKNYCKKIYIVEISENCINYCKKRFRESDNIEYIVNDGKSLEMIPDKSIDFVFSFDSLVHAELDVIEEYLTQLTKKMKDGGSGFVHHSNRKMYLSFYKFLFRLRFPFLTKRTHWRAKTVTADKFSDICGKNGLSCISNELINWGGKFLIDSLSTFNKSSIKNRVIIKNYDFMKEAEIVKKLSKIY